MEVGVQDDAAARYSAWAGRMRDKRTAAKQRIAADQASTMPGTATGDGPAGGYWSTEALFADSRAAEEASLHQAPAKGAIADLLAVLDLRDDADPDQLTAAYRRLAKEHHPDRFADADEATRADHVERMLEINRAYQHLKTILQP